MSISIFYHASTRYMGNCSEQDASDYRSWAHNEIQLEYPDAKVGVLDQDGSSRVFAYAMAVDGIEYEDDDTEESILTFLCQLWDRCP